MKFRTHWILLFLLLGMMACKKPVNFSDPSKNTFIRGADLSKLAESLRRKKHTEFQMVIIHTGKRINSKHSYK